MKNCLTRFFFFYAVACGEVGALHIDSSERIKRDGDSSSPRLNKVSLRRRYQSPYIYRFSPSMIGSRSHFDKEGQELS